MSDDKKKISLGLVPVYEVPPEVEITSDEVDKLEHNSVFNDIYAEYYEQLADALDKEQYKRNAERMLNCHKHWFGDHYIMQEVFDVQHVLLCHDRFCVNCQHLKQAAQLQKFTKILEEAAKGHDLYLMTLTVPNCPISGLKDSLDRFAHAFRNIIRYFTGNSKVAGVNFDYYGFYAAYRNIEIVINPDSFHPHYHAVLALKPGLDEQKLYTNDYSFDHGVFKRKFSDLEILIQKVLALGYNNIRFDRIVVDYVLNGVVVDEKKLLAWCKKYKVDMQLLKNIRREGYSCTIDKIEGESWHEAFKYATKLTKDGVPQISYYQFETLVPLLKHMHLGQGYGAWHKLPKDKWKIDPDVLAAYEYVVKQLKAVENPVGITFKVLELQKKLHEKSIKCISRKKAYKIVQQWLELEKETAPEETPAEPAEPAKPEERWVQPGLFDNLPDDDDDLPF